MITIEQNNDTNICIVTLQERVTISNPYFYLFSFFNTETKVETYLKLLDQSSYPEAFNKFEIDGTVFETGDYKYKIYQSSTGVPEPEIDDVFLEEGFAKVIGESAVIDKYAVDTNEVKVYRG